METCLITIQHFSMFLLDVKLINREIWNFLCCSVFDSRSLFIFRSARFCRKPILAGSMMNSHFRSCCCCESATLWCMFTLEMSDLIMSRRTKSPSRQTLHHVLLFVFIFSANQKLREANWNSHAIHGSSK